IAACEQQERQERNRDELEALPGKAAPGAEQMIAQVESRWSDHHPAYARLPGRRRRGDLTEIPERSLNPVDRTGPFAEPPRGLLKGGESWWHVVKKRLDLAPSRAGTGDGDRRKHQVHEQCRDDARNTTAYEP